MAYCNHLSVKMASENSSEDEFKTLHGPLIQTDHNTWSRVHKPHISMPQHHAEVGTRLIR